MKKKPTSKANVYKNNYNHVTGLKFAGKGKVELAPRKTGSKVWGHCDVCDMYTLLVYPTGLCGPCCFGESETLNGNW
jgi:hypothetical protein